MALNRYAGITGPPPEPSQAPAEPSPDTSQHGEASLLQQLVSGDGFPPYVVDVGAHDGATRSTSRPFVLQGWHALLVEPHPVQFARLQER